MGSGLAADGVVIKAGPPGALFAFGYNGGGTAVESVGVAAYSAALGRVVIKRVMYMAVDKAGADDLAVHVDHCLDTRGVDLFFKTKGGDFTVPHHDGIAGMTPRSISPLTILSSI